MWSKLEKECVFKSLLISQWSTLYTFNLHILFSGMFQINLALKYVMCCFFLGAAPWWHHWHRVSQSGRHVPAASPAGHDGSGGASGRTLPAAPQPRRTQHPRHPLSQERCERFASSCVVSMLTMMKDAIKNYKLCFISTFLFVQWLNKLA